MAIAARALIREQLELLTPSLIVACGSGNALAAALLHPGKPAWTKIADEQGVRVGTLRLRLLECRQLWPSLTQRHGYLFPTSCTVS